MHGDYRIDNCLMGKQMPPTIKAVLDWELATLGEPLADLGLFIFYWREPDDVRPALTPAPTMQPGFPPRAYLVERYANRTGADVSGLPSWIALAHFKSAVIAQGIAARVQAGAMAGQDFGDIAGEVDRIAVGGLALLTDSGLPVRRRPRRVTCPARVCSGLQNERSDRRRLRSLPPRPRTRHVEKGRDSR